MLKESNDLDWIEDVPTTMPLTEWVKLNDIKIYKELFGLTVLLREDSKWWDDGTYEYGEDEHNPHYVEGVIIDAYGDEYDDIEPYGMSIGVEWANGKTNSYDLEDLNVVIKKDGLNEEADKDLGWIEEQPINPFYEYDGVIFDKNPTFQEFKELVYMALNTKKITNAREWTEFDLPYESIIEYHPAYLFIGPEDFTLSYGRKKDFNLSDYKLLNFSHLKGGLNEELDADLQWIHDLPIEVPYEHLVEGQTYKVVLNNVEEIVEALKDKCDWDEEWVDALLSTTKAKVIEKGKNKKVAVDCDHTASDYNELIDTIILDVGSPVEHFWAKKEWVSFYFV